MRLKDFIRSQKRRPDDGVRDHAMQGDFWTLSFEDAPDHRFNPFGLTEVWPHGDCPLTEVCRMTLNENPEDFFVHVEQASFESSNLVPGIGPSRTRCCSAGSSPARARTATGSARTTRSSRRTVPGTA